MKDAIYPEFKGMCAMITGGARNIGLAIGKELAERGADVALVDICRDLETIPYKLSSTRDLDEGVKALSSLGVSALGLTCDVRREDQVKSAVREVVATFGRLDILVNSAGVVSLFSMEQLSETAWDEVVDVCLKGTFFCCKHALPHMIRREHGKIVNISSVAGKRGLGLSVHYCAAKHGVLGLTKALAMETADHHINVNALCPGTVESPMLNGLASQVGLGTDVYEHFSKGHLIKDHRIAPEDIAHAVRWLVSEESRFITGAIIDVDAGWMTAG
ncbi:SDR family oxidoreductase [Thermodesulfobacteriota bacterium]